MSNDVRDDHERLRLEFHDLAYLVFEAIGVGWIVRRLGLTPKPWYADAALRVERKREHRHA
jgi:hypothetical protein